MNDSIKLEICNRQARVILRRYPIARRHTCIDELINIGFLGITSDNENYAAMQAYLWMLNFVTKKSRLRLPSPNYFFHQQVKSIGTVDDLIDLADALRNLSDIERKVIYLRFWEGCTYKEIATQIGKSAPSAALKDTRGALKKLKRFFTLKGTNNGREAVVQE